jgi:uncharacterized protein (DUF1015 family)
VPDLGAVLCPPYDIISAQERARLAARDPRNAVHVELPTAAPGEDPYAAAAGVFERWQSDGVLRRDDRPWLYVYEQAFSGGIARGFFCRLLLEQPGASVRRHERTMAGPKEDRLRLLRAVRANLSPVLLLYDDGARGARSRALLDELSDTAPVATASDDGGTRHRLWLVDPAAKAAAELLALGARDGLTIADGHHRYETALRHRDEVGRGSGADYVLALLYDASSGGLQILPTHRLLSGVGDGTALLDEVDTLFERQPAADGATLAAAVARAGEGTLGLWTRAGGGLLRARANAIAPRLPAGPAALRRLDVSVLGAALREICAADPDALAESGRLSYTKDAALALAEVEAGRVDACFLLAPTPVQDVLAVAAAGELMPPKSTYFVPKAATGMLFNLLDQK